MKKLLKWIENQRGLTLIELLAVVVVLGILAAIAVPAIQGTIDKQRLNADEASGEVIKTASLRYLYDHYVEGPSSSLPGTAALEVDSGKYKVDVGKLKSLGYLADDFNLDWQSDPSKSFSKVNVKHTGKGWVIDGLDPDPTPSSSSDDDDDE